MYSFKISDSFLTFGKLFRCTYIYVDCKLLIFYGDFRGRHSTKKVGPVLWLF